MNIYIYNCSNTFNYGSMMMGENFIKYFNEITGQENRYYVETNEEVNIKRLKEATDVENIFMVEVNSLFKNGINKYDYLFGCLKIKNILSDFSKKIDLAIVLGGDDFTEDYGWKGPVINAIKFNILKREGIKVIMLGQTMGPYNSFRKPLMKSLLNNLDKIYPRDSITFNYLKELGLRNINITDDLALLPLTKQKVQENDKKYITYCPSELIYRYSKEGNREDWINFNLFMIENIMEEYPNFDLVLLAHVLKPEHVNDSIIANELYNLVEEKYKERIILKVNEMYPYEVREYIQQSLFTVSSRMHPIVSSIQCEVPAIAISYSNKYWGIIGERYDLKDYIIDVRYHSYDEMEENFKLMLQNIENNYNEIQKSMKDNNKLASKKIKDALIEIANLYDKKK